MTLAHVLITFLVLNVWVLLAMTLQLQELKRSHAQLKQLIFSKMEQASTMSADELSRLSNPNGRVDQ